MSDQKVYCVRVRPYNPKRKAITRRCTFRGRRFDHTDDWVQVTNYDIAKEMSELKDQNGYAIFEVKTLKQAKTDRRRRDNDPELGGLVADDEFRTQEKASGPFLGKGETLHPAARAFMTEEEAEEREEDFAPEVLEEEAELDEDPAMEVADFTEKPAAKAPRKRVSASAKKKAAAKRKATPRARRSSEV